jgi:GTP cyclohydrolase II
MNSFSDPIAAVRILRSVDRAIGELRRGGMVRLIDAEGRTTLMLAAEPLNDDGLENMRELAAQAPALVITGRRATALSLQSEDKKAVALTRPEGLTAEIVRRLADPCNDQAYGKPTEGWKILPIPCPPCAAAAIALSKTARLLPAAVLAPLDPNQESKCAAFDLLSVAIPDVLIYQEAADRSLTIIGEANVPIHAAENTRVVAFRPRDGGVEHLAIIIGAPNLALPVLTRLHSQCFTGDLLGSLRCDCGDQLRGAIEEITQAGGGVLLYLAQEGRGIGLVNKLRAYQLQDGGFDTLDANGQLGFDDDERLYLPAARMLDLLGVSKVRLLTNNPQKMAELARHGIEIVERVPHVFPSNDHNESYLRTKATKGGHLF